MTEGYRDGRNLDSPEASENRSHSYRHGFMVGRKEKLNGKPAASPEALRRAAKVAELQDEALSKDMEGWTL
jgi:hypothetical protein